MVARRGATFCVPGWRGGQGGAAGDRRQVWHHDRDAKVGKQRLAELVDTQEHVEIEAVDDEQTLDQVLGVSLMETTRGKGGGVEEGGVDTGREEEASEKEDGTVCGRKIWESEVGTGLAGRSPGPTDTLSHHTQIHFDNKLDLADTARG